MSENQNARPLIREKRASELRVGDSVVINNATYFRIDVIRPGIAGILCPILEGEYVGARTGKSVIDIGANPKLQDHIFTVILPQ